MKVKHISKTALRKKAWKLRSEYIRRAENGICFTCGKHDDWKNMHAGHYIHGVLDFDDVNIHCQCPRCNKWLSGNQGVYCERLIAEYGLEAVTFLRERAKTEKKGGKYTIDEIEGFINKYTDLLKTLEGVK